MKRAGLIIATFVLLGGCTQEHLVFLRNLDRAQLISLEQVLQESGLKTAAGRKKNADHKEGQIPENRISGSNDSVRKSVPASANRTVVVKPDEDFSISPPSAGGMVVLKNVQGGATWRREKSNPAENFYFFRSGVADAKVTFQIFSTDGALLTNWNVFIQIQRNQGSQSSVSLTGIPITNRSYAAAASASSIRQSGPSETDTGSSASSGNPAEGDIAGAIISTLRGLSKVESVAELKRMLSATEFSEADRAVIKSRLIDLQISERMLTDAESEISGVSEPFQKALWQGKLARARKKDREAMRYCLIALGGDAATRKTAISELESISLAVGSVESALADRLQTETEKLKQDKEFYSNSLIEIARIRQLQKDVYGAEELLNRVINGDYPASAVKRAKKALEELKKDFLEYR